MITKLEITLDEDGQYRVHATKRFTEEHGGGEATITLRPARASIHQALDDARGIATLHRSDRAGFEASLDA